MENIFRRFDFFLLCLTGLLFMEAFTVYYADQVANFDLQAVKSEQTISCGLDGQNIRNNFTDAEKANRSKGGSHACGALNFLCGITDPRKRLFNGASTCT